MITNGRSVEAFKAALDRLLGNLTTNEDFSVSYEVLTMLGCPHIEYVRRGFKCSMDDWKLMIPEKTAEIYQELVDHYLSEILGRWAVAGDRSIVQTTCILAGIVRQNRYASYFDTEEKTYVLASTVLNYLEEYSDDNETDALIKDEICAMLSAWLKPAIPWKVIPSARTAAIAMFGSGWCSLFASSWTPHSVGALKACENYLGFLIYQERPPFLPGLCPAQQDQMSAPLPNLG